MVRSFRVKIFQIFFQNYLYHYLSIDLSFIVWLTWVQRLSFSNWLLWKARSILYVRSAGSYWAPVEVSSTMPYFGYAVSGNSQSFTTFNYSWRIFFCIRKTSWISYPGEPIIQKIHSGESKFGKYLKQKISRSIIYI